MQHAALGGSYANFRKTLTEIALCGMPRNWKQGPVR
jgi:hypothetical protein